MKRKNRCFINQTHIWKWSLDALFLAENLTCIGIKQSKTMQMKQLFVCDRMTRKKKFPFFVIWSKTNICFCMMTKKGKFLFFWSCDQKQIFNFNKCPKKGNFFLLVFLSISNICFWQNDRKKEIPFFGHLSQIKYLFLHVLQLYFCFLFFWHFALFHVASGAETNNQ